MIDSGPVICPHASHILSAVGLYNEAAISNIKAVEADEKYIEAEAPQGLYRMMYYPHNIDFLWAAQQMEGRSVEAIETARKLAERTPPAVARQFPLLEAWTATPLYALVRFGKWQEILKNLSTEDFALHDWDFGIMLGPWRLLNQQMEDAKRNSSPGGLSQL